MRVQWREWRANLKTPVAGDVKWEDGHDVESVAQKVRELLQGEPPCWIYIERQDVEFKGSSAEKPKPTRAKGKK